MKREPLVLIMPEGLNADAIESIGRQCRNLSLLGYQILAVPHGTVHAPHVVEHHLGGAADEALIALPRIAAALEALHRDLREQFNYRFNRGGTPL